jgi:hypothetical protein
MNVNSWPLTCALGAAVLAATTLALGDALHGDGARAQTALPGASLSFTTDAPAKGVAGGGQPIIGTVTYQAGGLVETPVLRCAPGQRCATPSATASAGGGLTTGPLRPVQLLQPVTVTLGTPCLNFVGTCPAPAATLPASIDVYPGVPKTFSITTTAVDSEDDVALVAIYGDLTGQTVLKVLPPQAHSLILQPNPVVAPNIFFAKVCLDGPAPADGAQGNLTSDNNDEFSAQLSIPPGSNCDSGGTNWETNGDGGSTRTLTATINGGSAMATLTIAAPTATATPTPTGTPRLASILIDGQTIDGPFYSSPENPVSVIIELDLTADAPPPSGATVKIAVQGATLPGDNDSAVLIDVPTAIMIPQGTASVTYTKMTVAGCTFSNICDAELDASYRGIAVKAWVQTQCPSCVVNTP